MAIIVGQTDGEEMAKLLNAGYDFVTPGDVALLFNSMSLVGAVWVDCDISDLLIPPLCKFCGRLMETHLHPIPGSDTVRTVHNCECGAQTWVYENPPEEE